MEKHAFAVLVVLGLVAPAFSQGIDSSPPPHPTLPTCARNDSQLLLPDLIAETPAAARTALRGGRRLVEFETAVGNIGNGPLIIEGRTLSTDEGIVTQGFQIITRRDGSRCARHAGIFEFHRAHTHWHFEDFVAYEFRSGNPDSGEFATSGRKASFCLLDLEPIGRNPPPRQLTNQSCNAQEGQQGISVGWKDVYDRSLPDQSLDLDEPVSVPKGSYFLVNAVDPTDRIWETNENNNRASVPVSVSIDGRVFPTYAVEPTPTVRPGGPLPTATRPRRPVTHPTRRPRPTRQPRPDRPSLTTPTPRTTSPAAPTPTATRPSASGSCPVTCNYPTSQVRFTWYDEAAGGLNLSFSMRRNACPPFSPSPGESGTITMSRWLKQNGEDTGRLHQVGFTLGSGPAGATSDGGIVRFSPGRSGDHTVTYTSPAPPIAGTGLGLDFPVVFDLCTTVGDQTFYTRLVCQEKPRGILCHAG